MSLHPDHPRKSYPSPVAPEKTHDDVVMQAPDAAPAILADGAAPGHAPRFTRAQIDLQREIGQTDGFPAIQAVLRAQFTRSMQR